MEYRKVSEIKEMNHGIFRYCTSFPPIDFFGYSLTKEQIMESLSDDYYADRMVDEVQEAYEYVDAYVTHVEEKPHTIRFIGIPQVGGACLELVAISKIQNNGTCYIFSNNYEFLASIL